MLDKKAEGIVTLEANISTGNSFDRKQIAFDQKSGLILEIGSLKIPPKSLDFEFNDDSILFSGFGDVHVHAREDVSQKHIYKEDYRSVSNAAINGGVVLIGDMPNNPVPPIDENSYIEKLKLTSVSPISIFLYAGIGKNLKAFNQFKVPYKVFMGPSIGELFFSDKISLEETLSNYIGERVSFHCEDSDILEKNKNESSHSLRRPKLAELLSTIDAIKYIEKFNLRGKLCHYSIGEGLPLIRDAKKRGVPVEMEVTPQHLYFSMERIEKMGLSKEQVNFLQMNPPIRLEEDREALLEALKNGEVDYLATDHAPHSLEEKQKGTSGLTGLDTYANLVSWLIKSEKVDPKIISKVCCENPGTFFNQFLESWKKIFPNYQKWGKGIGILEPGYSANFTIINMNKEYQVRNENLFTKAKSSPFDQLLFPGRVERLFLLGKEIIPSR